MTDGEKTKTPFLTWRSAGWGLVLLTILLSTRPLLARSDIIPSTFIGLHHHREGLTTDYTQEPDPALTVPFGSVRLWDTGTTWSDLETSRGQYNWTILDDWFTHLKAAPQDLLYTIAVVPTWAASDTTSSFNAQCRVIGGCTPPCDLSPGTVCADGSSSTSVCFDGSQGDCRYKEYVTALVTHSCLNDYTNTNSGSRCPAQPGRINAYELWNEPDLGIGSSDIEWTGTMAQMVTLARDASAIIRRLDPSAKIVTPSPTTAAAATWLQSFLTTTDQDGQNNGDAYVDVVGFHAYLDVNDPPPAEAVVPRINAITALTSKPVWDTESSWGTESVNGVLVSRLPDLNAEAAFVVKDYLLHWSAGAERFYWYAWDGLAWGAMINEPTDGSGTSWGLLPDAVAYAQVAQWMIGSTLLSPCSQASNQVWSCAMQDSAGHPQVAVWDSISTATFTVPSGYLQYTDITGQRFSIGTNRTLSVGNSPLLLTVSSAPPTSAYSPTSDSARVYPNPWRQDKHADRPIIFDTLRNGSSVTIFSTSGHLVATLPVQGASAAWTLTNRSGSKVASGIYLYTAVDSQGNKIRGTVAVIR